MQVLVFGAMSMIGRSKKTGADYAMHRLYVASQIGPRKTDDYTRQACGYEAAEVEVDQQAFGQFLDRKYPCVMQLQTDMRLQGGRLVPVVVGIVETKAA